MEKGRTKKVGVSGVSWGCLSICAGVPLPFLGQEGHTWPMREQVGVPWGGPTLTSGKSQREDSHPRTFILSALSLLHGHHHELNGLP